MKLFALAAAGGGLWTMLFGDLAIGMCLLMCGLLIAHDHDNDTDGSNP